MHVTIYDELKLLRQHQQVQLDDSIVAIFTQKGCIAAFPDAHCHACAAKGKQYRSVM